ncbi:Presilphiperfolan-8-beta-ol synthase [Microdochium bolleyi]|uniref:Terpene synthase n=1 Tax=Microdochium bolleyi TaxID=196109 RepID=A0A136J950_9PEZI|nr:Presilphiperfolan-8-beta-ol synthase [Microdochium bolleyi]
MSSSTASSDSATRSSSPARSDSSFLTAPTPLPADLGCLNERGQQISVRIPDLFASVMGTENRVNPFYTIVKARSDAYIARTLQLSEKTAYKTSKADFAFLTASWIPEATEAALYVIQLWQEWVFFFDDQFDEGHLSKDPLRAAEEVVNSLAVLDASYPVVNANDNPLAFLLQRVWLDFKKTASEEHQYRFKFYHKKYMIGLLRQVKANVSNEDHTRQSMDSYIEYRRDTIGAEAPYVMMEWAYGLSLPTHVVSHPSLVTCCLAAIDITLLDNDILSLKKDLDYDVKHNAINVLRASKGHTIQQAIDEVSDMLDERYAAWHAAVDALPVSSWGPEIEAQVRKLLELYIRIPIGTLHWSFRSGRYFGDEGQEVRDTRIMNITLKG